MLRSHDLGTRSRTTASIYTELEVSMRKLWAGVVLLGIRIASGQEPPSQAPVPTADITARTTLVLVPTMVTTSRGEPVFTLKVDDFVVTDDGVEQKLSLEEDTGGEPLAMVVVIETGSAGARQMDKYRALGPLIEAAVGGVEHKVAVVEFDSTAGVSRTFTPDLDKVSSTIEHMDAGDGGGGIFDGLALAVDMLGKQPPKYRRAILLISETVDHGSKLKVADALRTISDSNTAIYSLAFSSTRAELGRAGSSNLPHGGAEPGPPGGCMADDPDKESDPTQTKAKRALDCAGILLPPILLVRAAIRAAINGLKQNVPETVARVSGGEYYKFSDQKGLQRDLTAIANHMANRYVLSFHPQAPHPGFHAIGVSLREYKGVKLQARNGYWVDEDTPKP
jgi:VWFA-related protein